MVLNRRRFISAMIATTLSGCAAVNQILKGVGVTKPELMATGAQLTSVSMDHLELNFLFSLNNPNPISITIVDLDYRLKVNGKQVATGNQTKSIVVEANGRTDFSIPAEIAISEVLSGVALKLPDTLNYEIELRIGVSSPAGRLPISIVQPGQISVRN